MSRQPAPKNVGGGCAQCLKHTDIFVLFENASNNKHI